MGWETQPLRLLTYFNNGASLTCDLFSRPSLESQNSFGPTKTSLTIWHNMTTGSRCDTIDFGITQEKTKPHLLSSELAPVLSVPNQRQFLPSQSSKRHFVRS